MEQGWLERQLEEVESLRAIYSEDDALRVDEQSLAGLQRALDSLTLGIDASRPTLSPVSLSIRVHQTNEGVGLRLAAVLPIGYPAVGSEPPIIWLEPEMQSLTSSTDALAAVVLSMADDEQLCTRLQAVAAENAAKGGESMLSLIQTAEEWIRDEVDDVAMAVAAATEDCDDGLADDEAATLSLIKDLSAACVTVQSQPQRLGRRAMYSHHIIAPSKREAISHWARQLRLGGLAKVGWPGIIIVEGDERDVSAYVEALSRLRWKHFVVRGEQTVDTLHGESIDVLRLLPLDFEEYPPDGMTAFSSRCRQLGVEDLFLACLKIYGGSTSRGGATNKVRDVEAHSASFASNGKRTSKRH